MNREQERAWRDFAVWLARIPRSPYLRQLCALREDLLDAAKDYAEARGFSEVEVDHATETIVVTWPGGGGARD